MLKCLIEMSVSLRMLIQYEVLECTHHFSSSGIFIRVPLRHIHIHQLWLCTFVSGHISVVNSNYL